MLHCMQHTVQREENKTKINSIVISRCLNATRHYLQQIKVNKKKSLFRNKANANVLFLLLFFILPNKNNKKKKRKNRLSAKLIIQVQLILSIVIYIVFVVVI